MKTTKPTQPETAGCLSVLLPATPEFPEESSARFVLMTPDAYEATLHSGKLLQPSDHESKASDSDEGF